MTVLARNEADIIEAWLAFHLNAGCDFVVATDNLSEDGTTEILERYEREGYVHLIHEPADDMRQDEWATRMARIAATKFGADWVVNSDADEFWWPREGSLNEVLSAVPERFGLVRGCWRHFVPRADGDAFFAERMTARLATPAHPGDKTTIFHANQKVAHRADPEVVVEFGNHDAVGARLAPLRGWHPIEVLHFSIRTAAQLARKARGAWMRNPHYTPVEHDVRFHDAYREGRVDEYFRGFAVDDAELASGLESGRFVVDTRLRDALRELRVSGTSELRPVLQREGSAPLTFPRPDVGADADYAAEASMLAEIDGVVRAERRVAELETRLSALEHGRLSRLDGQ